MTNYEAAKQKWHALVLKSIDPIWGKQNFIPPWEKECWGSGSIPRKKYCIQTLTLTLLPEYNGILTGVRRNSYHSRRKLLKE